MNLDLQNRSEIEKEIVGALKSALDAHGPITRSNVNSAAKRIYRALGGLAKRRRREMDKMTELTTERQLETSLAPAGDSRVVPVRRGGRTLHLQDGQWLPAWLVRLRRRKYAVLALAAVVAAGWGLLRLAGRAR